MFSLRLDGGPGLVAPNRLLKVRESDPYLRGLVVWLGFTQVFVPYERDASHAGRTHFPRLWKKIPHPLSDSRPRRARR